jgi:uncharacterized protein YggU (UPF0235/DUF167 family)
MRFHIKVTPRSRHTVVNKAVDGTLVVRVNEPAEDGRANAAAIAALADYFGVAKSAVSIVHGHGSRRKLMEIKQ